ncbi:MAG: M14 family zinc carboxypeptidase [Planctomycetota bacterium]
MLHGPRLSTLSVTLLVVAALVALRRGDERALAAPASDTDSLESPFAAPTDGYHSLGEVTLLLDSWCQTDPSRVTHVELPQSASGLTPPAVLFGAGGVDAAPLESRSTVLLLGGLDGRSLAGSEAALRAAYGLLVGLDTLRTDLAFLVVPWASPDGLARAVAGERHDGRDGTACDDDEDGASGEDPPDDLDGDGQVLELLLEDSRGAWTFSRDRRFVVRASDGDSPRFERAREGRDDDGDGRWNEDGFGGVQLDAHFPSGWKGPGGDGSAGRFPLDDQLARALADLALERRTMIALVFQGNHGGVARPGGTLVAELASGRDRAAYAFLGSAYARATGRASSEVPALRAARERECPGAAIDWLHGAVGALAAEVAVWGPDAVGRDGRANQRRLTPLPETRSGPAPTDTQRRWARWVDDVCGGLDFAEWRPVELGIGRRAWVGGWRNRVDLDPPVELLPHALNGVAPFVREVVDALPRLDIEVLRLERTGELVRLRARVVNRGAFATALGGAGALNAPKGSGALHSSGALGALDGERARVPGEVVFTLEAPCDDALLAGHAVNAVGVLGGGGASQDFEWLISAPPGSVLTLHAVAGETGRARRDLRP